jgi:hypothetical protein
MTYFFWGGVVCYTTFALGFEWSTVGVQRKEKQEVINMGATAPLRRTGLNDWLIVNLGLTSELWGALTGTDDINGEGRADLDTNDH